MAFEWDTKKARENFRKHDGVRFEESKAVFDDPYAITITDDESDPFEKRFITMGMAMLGRVLVVVWTWRDENIRIISARLAVPHEHVEYEAGLS
ncbi:MAG TPA: BrnT family toxin [Bryobacteraceae bacterium]|nr:BrnT family toxin [Bryobacteraceae bacterium]